MGKLIKLLPLLLRGVDFFLAPFWCAFIVLLISQIVARYIFQTPLMWAEEVARVSLLWLTFIGAARVALIDDHIDIPIISRRAAGNVKKLLDSLKACCIVMTSFMLVYGGWKLLEFSSSAVSPGAGLSLSWWYWPAILGGGGMMFSVILLFSPRKKVL